MNDIDADAFMRASGLFANKRRLLPEGPVLSLAKEVVRRLSSLDRPEAAPDTTVSEESLSEFCDILIQPTSDAALRFIRSRQADGVSRDTVFYGYVAGAARMLGTRWEQDEASFIDVTVGAGHLYALMRAIRSERPISLSYRSDQRSALFATVPGETHSLGISVAADTFREAGWDIDLRLDFSEHDLAEHVGRHHPTIIGLSLSTEGRLADLAALVVSLRLRAPHAIIGVAPAANMGDQSIHDIADVDLIFRDARSAVRQLDHMLRLRA
jgi:MerR family transcriptional regulator, light-induced transcriptional regulator